MADIEKKLVDYVVDTRFEDIPQRPLDVMKDVTLNTIGAIVAGATVGGCPEAVEQSKQWGGKPESTILIYGDKVAAGNAAFANSFMAKAAAISEGMDRGVHVGGSSVPTALAVAELVGGCSGKDFLAALVVGTELAARVNTAAIYDTFSRSGVCAFFTTAAIAGRILGLNSQQMWNALGHAFDRSGGSQQGSVDGSVSARVNQGAASQWGIMSAQLAQRGITGPINFLQGIYGCFQLYAGDKYDPEVVAGELGKRFELNKTFFKKYPSCGTTNPSIDATLELMQEKGVIPEEVAEVKVTVTPFIHNLTGKPFEYGDNPRISAVYSIQYCVANALLRKSCRLSHFDESSVKEPRIMELIKKIHVFPDAALEKRTPVATDVEVRMTNGAVYHKSVDSPRGYPENPLTREEFADRFQDCVSYGGRPLPQENIRRIISLVERLEELDDVRALIGLLIS